MPSAKHKQGCEQGRESENCAVSINIESKYFNKGKTNWEKLSDYNENERKYFLLIRFLFSPFVWRMLLFGVDLWTLRFKPKTKRKLDWKANDKYISCDCAHTVALVDVIVAVVVAANHPDDYV